MSIATKPDADAQLRGYLLSEDEAWALLDLGNALDGLALMVDETPDGPELAPCHWSGLLRTFSRQARAIHGGAGFVHKAIPLPQRR